MSRSFERWSFAAPWALLQVPLLLLVAACAPQENTEVQVEDTAQAPEEDTSEGHGDETQGNEVVRKIRPEEEAAFAGFQRFLDRGAFPALREPDFVSAAEAEIPDDAWIMGFELNGAAYAYDVNTLNHHEVVNHTIGDQPVAAVW